MICYFIDHGTYRKGEKQLAELSLLHKGANFLDEKLGASIITCHRIEYYISSTKHIGNLKSILNGFNEISDSKKIYWRLFRIALGLDSKIIGENVIFKQVAKSINDYLYYNPESRIFMNILINAQKTRDKFGFYIKNHGQLIYDHIKNDQGRSIIIFGAGLLNQTIISSINYPADYENIFLVTRNVQKAKTSIVNAKVPVRIIGLNEINEILPSRFYDIFIATDSMDYIYRNKLIGLCRSNRCLNVVDVSSIPAPELDKFTSNYFSLYSENTADFVNESNQEVLKKQKALEKYLGSKGDDWYIHY